MTGGLAETRIRQATAQDADAIVAQLRQCYRDTYCSPEGLDPATIARRIEQGSSIFVVAEEGNRLVGQVAIERRGPSGLYEYGKGAVRPEERGRGVLTRMSTMLLTELAPRAGAQYVFGRYVTNHVVAQRNGAAAGFVPTGLLLGAIPARTFMAGFGPVEEPLSALIMILRLEAAPRTRVLRLAGADLHRATAALGRLGVPWRRGTVDRSGALGLRPIVEADPSTGLRLVRLVPDEGALVDGDLDIFRALGPRLTWIDVPSEHPEAATWIERIRDRGFSFGAYLPLAGANGADVVRLQRCRDPEPIVPARIRVLEDSRALVDDVFADAQVGASLQW